MNEINSCDRALNKETSKKNKQSFPQKVASIAGDIVSMKGHVSPIDLLIGLGWLTTTKLTDWKMGKVPYLERVVTSNLSKLSKAMKEFRVWATHSKLKTSIISYRHKNLLLRFSKSGNPNIEKAYSTHYVLSKANKKEA